MRERVGNEKEKMTRSVIDDGERLNLFLLRLRCGLTFAYGFRFLHF